MTPDLPAFRIGSTAKALRELADAIETHPIPDSREATKREVQRITHAALNLTRLIAGASRVCVQCGKPIARHRFANGRLETPTSYQRRKYCSLACNGASTRKRHETPRACQQCGAVLKRRANEPWARYVARKYCDRVCAGAAKSRTAREERQANPPKPRARPKPKPKPAAAPERIERPQAAAPRPLPDPRPKPIEAGVRMVTLGTPCPKHPGEYIGFYGCPACRAAEAWRAGERAVTLRPSLEGGR